LTRKKDKKKERKGKKKKKKQKKKNNKTTRITQTESALLTADNHRSSPTTKLRPTNRQTQEIKKKKS